MAQQLCSLSTWLALRATAGTPVKHQWFRSVLCRPLLSKGSSSPQESSELPALSVGHVTIAVSVLTNSLPCTYFDFACCTSITMQTLLTCNLSGAGVRSATQASCSFRNCRSRNLPARQFQAFAAAPRRSFRAHRNTRHHIRAAAASKADSEDHIQLATAKLPK